MLKISLYGQIKKINEYYNKYSSLEQEQIQQKFKKLKEEYKNNKNLNKLLVKSFALTKVAIFRTLNIVAFNEQLFAGIVLHKGNIAESPTGSGKTLIATFPSVLNAITGESVLIITVNDYLAKRDAIEMGKVYSYLGLETGYIQGKMKLEERKENYKCDIVYVTNSELGFDYLKDNLVKDEENKVLRPFYYCIIDEADSVLIDDAKTPLIISGKGTDSSSLYIAADLLAKKMNKGVNKKLSKVEIISGEKIEDGDFLIEEKDKIVHLTLNGINKIENFFHVNNLSNEKNSDLIHHMELALRANYIMKKGRDYIVKNDEILIVDEFTGRIMDGRRYSDGLHQAIEAKEGVTIKEESLTYASITYQNFFNKFPKKSGMTGTAITEKKEFKEVYHLNVIVIPPHKKVKRKDLPDLIFKDKDVKYEAILNEVKKTHETGQPVLIGTTNIITSELLSMKLKKMGIPNNLLSAKYVEKEAEIIKNAGKKYAVTIATNMAGRGTDIKINDEVRKLGGLKIIGSEKHESRRIDNQLRGRAGRQGDPGESRFYVSLDDDIIKLYGEYYEYDENMPDILTNPFIKKLVKASQKSVENNSYGIRYDLLQYDLINNHHREMIYLYRNNFLENEIILDIIKKTTFELIDYYTKNMKKFDDKETIEKIQKINSLFNLEITLEKEKDLKDLNNYLKKEINSKINKTYQAQNLFIINDNLKKYILSIIDFNFSRHLSNLEKLKETISLQSFANKDPLVEYKLTTQKMFDKMMLKIKKEIVKTFSGIIK